MDENMTDDELIEDENMTDDELIEDSLGEFEAAFADGDTARYSNAFERALALGASESDIDEILDRY